MFRTFCFPFFVKFHCHLWHGTGARENAIAQAAQTGQAVTKREWQLSASAVTLQQNEACPFETHFSFRLSSISHVRIVLTIRFFELFLQMDRYSYFCVKCSYYRYICADSNGLLQLSHARTFFVAASHGKVPALSSQRMKAYMTIRCIHQARHSEKTMFLARFRPFFLPESHLRLCVRMLDTWIK